MRKYVLASLVALIMLDIMLGIGLKLMPGVSLKNLYLYGLCVFLSLEAVSKNVDPHINLPYLTIPFAALIAYALLTWILITAAFGTSYSEIGYYPRRAAFIGWKSQLVDHFLFFLVFFYGVKTREEVIWLAKFVIWLVFVTNVITVADTLNLPDLGIIEERGDDRVNGPLGQPNEYGRYLSFMIPIGAAYLFTIKGFTGKLALGVMLICSLGLFFLTGSRGSMLGLLIALLFRYRFIASLFQSRVALVQWTLVFSVSAIIVAISVFALFPDVFISRIERTISENPTSGRFEIWGGALQKMLREPVTLVTGFGWYGWQGTLMNNAHNYYLYYFFNLGAIGLSLLIAILAGPLKYARRACLAAESDDKIFLAGFVVGLTAFCTSIIFGVSYLPWIFVWAYCGLMVRLAVQQVEPFSKHRREGPAPSPDQAMDPGNPRPNHLL